MKAVYLFGVIFLIIDLLLGFYIFDKGGHGWGMRNNFEYHNQWTNLFANWLKKI